MTMMQPANPYTSCANGCGVPAKWRVTKNGRNKNLCNTCATFSHPKITTSAPTPSQAERQRKREVLDRLNLGRSARHAALVR